MKKINFVIIIFVVFLCGLGVIKIFANDKGGSWGNDKFCIEVAQAISALDGVRDAAVLGRKGEYLVGVRLLGHEDSEEVRILAEEVVAQEIPRDRVYLCVDDELASKIVELCYYLDTPMDPKILTKRFDALVLENVTIQ